MSADDVAPPAIYRGTTGCPRRHAQSRQSDVRGVGLRRLGKPSRAERNAIERVICVLPLFHIFALTVVLLSSIGAEPDLAASAFDVEAVMRDIEVKKATHFPVVPTMWIAIASLPDLDKRDLSRWSASARAARRCRSSRQDSRAEVGMS